MERDWFKGCRGVDGVPWDARFERNRVVPSLPVLTVSLALLSLLTGGWAPSRRRRRHERCGRPGGGHGDRVLAAKDG